MTWRDGNNGPGEYIRRWDIMDWALLIIGLTVAVVVIVAVVTA